MDETFERYAENYNVLMEMLEEIGQEHILAQLLRDTETLAKQGYNLHK
jgi:hypothetical protein